MKRKILSALLALVILAAPLTSACAATVSPSTQKLKVDGAVVSAMVYNIDDSNYFRLRDIAYVLRNTDKRFEVGYDAASNTVLLTTGAFYTGAAPTGEAVRNPAYSLSSQTIRLDGRNVTMTAYNIDNYNFFKLRDLGDRLGFTVGYDETDRAMLITTKEAAAVTGLQFSTTDRSGAAVDQSVFAGHALTMINFWEPWCGPCVGEMPDLEKLWKNYKSKGFQILGVYATDGMEADVDAVLADTGVTYPILHWCDAFEQFETGYVPTTVFVDEHGELVGEALIGSRSYRDWVSVIEGML